MTSNDAATHKTAPPRRWPLVLTVTLLAFLAAGGFWILFQAAIAPIVADALRDYADDHGIEGMRLDVRRITPWQADFHTLRLVDEDSADQDQLRMDSLILDYTPWGLRSGVIDGIILSGLVLKLEKSATGWKLAGLPPRLRTNMAPSSIDATMISRPEWQVNHLEIRSSRLEIRHGRRQISLPFDLKVDFADDAGDGYRGRLICEPGDQSIHIAFELNWDRQQLTVAAAAEDLSLAPLGEMLAMDTTAPLAGRLAATAKARLKLAPLTLAAADIQLRLPEGTITGGSVWGVRVPTPETPLASIKLEADRTWVLHAPELALIHPERLHLRDWHGRLRPTDQGWELEGVFNLALTTPATDTAGKEVPLSGHTLPVTYQGRWQADGQWTLGLSGHGTPWEMRWRPTPKQVREAVQLNFTPRLELTAGGQGKQVKFQFDGHLADFIGLSRRNTIRIPRLSFRADGEGPWHRLRGRYLIQADNFRLNAKPINSHLPRLAVEGIFGTTDGHMRLSGHTRISRGVIRVAHRKIRLEGLRLDLPFTWPHAPSTAGGQIRLAALTWNDRALGAVRGRIRQRPRGLVFGLTHQSALLPGGQLQADGQLALDPGKTRPRMTIDYRFERALSREDVDLGTLKADWAGIHFNGRIAAAGRGIYETGKLHADLGVEFSGGRLVMPAQKSGVVGLKGAIAYPDLFALRTAPRQQIFFERTYIGDIAATDGRIDFQIEPGGVFFLEQGQFKWCRGNVYLPATRVVPAQDGYDLTLWCDRLKLAPLLEQLGAARADGGGSVSGRIPVRIRAGQFRVDNGFLYSSPGEGGTIRLRGTDLLTAGIPPGTPQYYQLELARQALKEYDYDWVKLSLATAPQEDLLHLKLQLNGRPTNPLPFIYDSQAGGFVPVDDGRPGSRFEEIKLDVNFSLPLNRLLEYKDLLKLFS